MSRSLLFSIGRLALLIAPAVLFAQTQERVIPNTLGDSWPHEHVSFDFPANALREPLTATLNGVSRPAQIERATVDGHEVSRVWTVVTLTPPKDDKGNVNRKEPGFLAPKISFAPGTARGLVMREEGEFYVIENGTYTARIRSYKKPLAGPTPLEKFPHWLGGIRQKGSEAWDGRPSFTGNAVIREAKTEIVARGPVHIDLRITYTGDERVPTEMVNAVPLMSGKQSFRFKPNEIPLEKVPAYQQRYEALIRFVLDDPWIDVAERAHFPRDPAIPVWGMNLYQIAFGGKEGIPVDTAMGIRWFEWDIFGGNTDINFDPADMRPAQRGRPFAMLRPIWNQGGAGSQDFYLTSGGPTPKWDSKTKSAIDPEGRYRADAPAIGVHAAYPSKWVGPFAQTIVAQAQGGNSGVIRLPLVPAGIQGFHYGQRAFGLCAGPRNLFDDTGRMNGMVRRHTDWTLNALINRYVLTWQRDPAKAGPHILATRPQLDAIRADFTKGANTASTRLIRQEWPAVLKARSEVASLKDKLKQAETAANAIKEEVARKAAQDELKPQRDELRKNERYLSSPDAAVLQLVVEGAGKPGNIIGSDLFRDRRYQDDFLNPTQSTVRRITGLGMIDLFAAGVPMGNGELAALGYIATDADYWMGWRNGWMPGNPNFHTDKYASALYIAGTILDHPHAREWAEYAMKNYLADVDLVFLAPDGVGVECPGYAGYAFHLLLPMNKALENLGMGNVLEKQPLAFKSGVWHRKLLTPVNPRTGMRHEAPIGDTHRWDSGLQSGYGLLANVARKANPAMAADMMSVWRFLEKSGVKGESSGEVLRQLVSMDYSLPEVPLERMDWSSQTFFGFGAILRTHFGTPRETFLTYKAGQIRGHYHNDENSFHYYANATPIALDYNCSYHPRGDHAALHNSMTFGATKPVVNNQKGVEVEAMEQLHNSAAMGAFATTEAGDLVVSERKGSSLSLTPVRPEDGEFARDYPSRKVEPIVHRRLLLLVKHPLESKFSDYLVVREETRSAEPQQVNLHLTARDLHIEGNRIDARGQFDRDISVFFADATSPHYFDRQWYYSDEWMFGPEEYWIREGETHAAWDQRMVALAKAKGVATLPPAGFKALYKNAQKGDNKPWQEHIGKTNGQALIPPINWRGPWAYGEYQKWLRVETAPGSPVLWVLYSYPRGGTAPKLETIPGGVRVSLDGQSEEIFVDSATGARVVRGGKESVVLAPNSLPPLGEIKDVPLSAKN